LKIISIARLRTRRAAFAAVLVSAAVALPLAFVPASGAAASIAAGPRPTIVLGSSNLILVPYPGAPAGVKDAYLKPGVFGSCLANGLPASQARALAATQRPLSTAAFTEPTGVPACLEDHPVLGGDRYCGSRDSARRAARDGEGGSRAYH